MNSNRIGRSFAAGSMVAVFLVAAGCSDLEAPAQDLTGGDRSSDTGGGVSTGNHKLPPDSRP